MYVHKPVMTSYRERYLSQLSQSMKQHQSPQSSMKTTPASILKRPGNGFEKNTDQESASLAIKDEHDANYNNNDTTSPQQVCPESKEIKNSSNSNAVTKTGDHGHAGATASSSNNGFHEMMNDYAEALNLNDYERQCLGFTKTRETDADGVPYTSTDGQGKSISESEKSYSEQGQPSTWRNLLDHLAVKNWFSSFTAADSNNNSDFDKGTSYNNAEPGGLYLEDGKAEKLTEQLENSNEVLTFGILSLINKVICDDAHFGGIGNCFKCAHKNSFRSYAVICMDAIEDIWKRTDLSPEEKSEMFTEMMEMWIYQLSEQNLALAEAYNCTLLANDKLTIHMREMRNSMKVLQKQNDKHVAKIDALNYELSLRDNAKNKQRYEHDIELEQMKEMKEALQESQNDVKSLTELVVRLRDKGVWDINGLPMGDSTFKKIFSDDYYLHGAKVISHKEFLAKRREWRNEIEQLKREQETLRAIIAAKDKEIQRKVVQL